jgi:hypothetical protein
MVAPAMTQIGQILAEARAQPLVFDNVCPELCPDLTQIILTHMQADRGRRTGSLNKGGWKSTEDFFLWPYEAVQTLRQTIAASIGVDPSIAWAMVNGTIITPEGSSHPRHQHRNAKLSGVFYVQAGDPLSPTVFECPCDGMPARGAQRFDMEVDPHPGRMVLCRGETWHQVRRYAGEYPRITVAFDVRR